ncbi:uncharacterized protein LOC124283455 [Haliotis rubra]|uniref:uncharacterized protein LOC124283455 n=1 Tax=Haliotis rubra TaxID=36100 RepID=UPI001EE5409D|nr:uncharacterized protein LOC124283455 [Haliotis rubra]
MAHGQHTVRAQEHVEEEPCRDFAHARAPVRVLLMVEPCVLAQDALPSPPVVTHKVVQLMVDGVTIARGQCTARAQLHVEEDLSSGPETGRAPTLPQPTEVGTVTVIPGTDLRGTVTLIPAQMMVGGVTTARGQCTARAQLHVEEDLSSGPETGRAPTLPQPTEVGTVTVIPGTDLRGTVTLTSAQLTVAGLTGKSGRMWTSAVSSVVAERRTRTAPGPVPTQARPSVEPTVTESYQNQTIDCNTEECGVDGGWTDWEEWQDVDECSVQCGGGKKDQDRSRTCTNPSPAFGGADCDGESYQNQTIDCNTEECGDRCADDGAFLAHATDEKRFYQCRNGRALRQQCPEGTVYDSENSICDHAINSAP